MNRLKYCNTEGKILNNESFLGHILAMFCVLSLERHTVNGTRVIVI